MLNVASYSTTAQVLALSRLSEMTPRLFDALMQRFGTLERLYHADSGAIMSIQGMTPSIANQISTAGSKLQDATEYLKKLEHLEIHAATRFDEDFPGSLRELHDPPITIYVRGKLPDESKKKVTLLPTSDAGQDSIALTTEAARQFAAMGVQIISNMNGGGAAHLGAKAGGGTSFAVIDSGIMHIHPSDYLPLAIDIAASGGVISEYEPEMKFVEMRYPETNRLLAALPQAVVVTDLRDNARDIDDLLLCCSQIGKLCFVLIDPEKRGLVDEQGLHRATVHGAIPIVGIEKLDQIVQSLV